MKYSDAFVSDCLAIRRQSPLVHNVTNYVAMNFSANALLAVGASPIMSSEALEAADIVSLSNALVVNIGCLEERQRGAILTAVQAASALGVPWVLDPAGAGASPFRMEFIRNLLTLFRPSVIRCNASEAAALCSAGHVRKSGRGMDSTIGGLDVLSEAERFASETGIVICISGPSDIITDGHTVIYVHNGSPVMARVTATGCCASAVLGAFLAVDGDRLAATFGAASIMGLAGEQAASVSNGPGTFAANFIDALAGIDPTKHSDRIKYEQESA